MIVLQQPRFNRQITHKDLPESDGKPMENSFELAQSMLLSIAAVPVLDRIYGALDYFIGTDHGIYWELTNPPLDGCKAPDWFFVPDVSSSAPDGDYRRSYVLWNELVSPAIVMEYVSSDGSEEHDRTPRTGKFWVYERAIRAETYVIFNPENGGMLEVYERKQGRYRAMKTNDRGRYEFPQMEVELGLWHGQYRGLTRTWMRFYDLEGKLLPNDLELALQKEQERLRAESERLRADEQEQRADEERRRADEQQQRAEALAAELAELKRKLQERQGDDSQRG